MLAGLVPSQVAAWRAKKAVDERNLAALRLYLETGNMDSARSDLPEELHGAVDLVNATLGQFEVPSEMTQSTVLKELLQELDMDHDDLADDAKDSVRQGVGLHVDHRNGSASARLHATLTELLSTMSPALQSADGAQGASPVLPRASRVLVERLVARALTQLPGKLSTNDAAFNTLLTALNLTADSTPDGGPTSMPASLRALLRHSSDTHCDGLRRQVRTCDTRACSTMCTGARRAVAAMGAWDGRLHVHDACELTPHAHSHARVPARAVRRPRARWRSARCRSS